MRSQEDQETVSNTAISSIDPSQPGNINVDSDMPLAQHSPSPPPPPPRVIDENTDMTTLTDQEIMQLMNGMQDASSNDIVSTKPLISTPVPISVIRGEYANGSETVIKKLDWLESQGWDQVWRAKGDGDCFYRSFTIAYLLRILHSEEPALAANMAFEAIQRNTAIMASVGFDSDLTEDFLDPLLAFIRRFANSEEEQPTEWSLVQDLQDPERSNSIVVVLRLIASAHVRTNENTFAPFLMDPLTFEPMTPDAFCRAEVEPCGREADHVQILALSQALGVHLRICYLDRSEISGGEANWVDFGSEEAVNAAEEEKLKGRPLTLLYSHRFILHATTYLLPLLGTGSRLAEVIKLFQVELGMAAARIIKPFGASMSVFRDNIFNGKTVLCTGGRSGIGYTIVNAMMRHGADSVIIGRDAEGLKSSASKLQEATGKRCLPASADVRKPEELKSAVLQAVEKFGKIDYVVCGAAGNFLAPISGLSENGFKTVVDIDLLGTYNTIKATLEHVRASQGAYVHISACLHYRGLPFQAHVSAAKAGVDALSQVLAVEEGPRGVRSNVIAPGPIGDTAGMDRLTPKGHDASQMIPMGRLGNKEDIANAALFLFSPAANWITGEIIVVDGGERHLSTTQLPYPQSVLDPESAKAIIKPKL